MGLKSASMGSLLQGVNQQPDRVRLEGQVTEQINMISDVTTGLSTRPGSKNVTALDTIGANPKYQNIVFKGEDYVISWDENASGNEQLRIAAIDGTEFNVVDNSDLSNQYVGGDMVFTVVEDQIVATNRDVVVKTLENTNPPTYRVALFQALGGEFLRTYTVEVSFSDGPGNDRIIAFGTYETPDGTTSGDGEKTTSDYIVKKLVESLQVNNIPAGTEINRQFDVASIYHPTRDIEITLSDGSGGTVLRGFSESVKNPEDLTRYAPNGKVVEVTNSAASEDNYWLKFETVNTEAVLTDDVFVNGDFATGDFTGWNYTSLSEDWSVVAGRAYLNTTDNQGGATISQNFPTSNDTMTLNFRIDWITSTSDMYVFFQSQDVNLGQITNVLPASTIYEQYSIEVPPGYDTVTFSLLFPQPGDTNELYLSDVELLQPVSSDGRIGFGTEGIWKETFNPYQDREYDLGTMPHVIEYDEVGDRFIFSEGAWLARPVGDSTTAPFASIVGKRIRDTIGFEGRLALLTPDNLVMSRTNETFDLWRESATVISDTDVIDIKSTKKNSLGMSWLVPFDRDLFIMSDPGDSQFIVKGGGLTPNNASMVLTTEFEIQSDGARPQSTGRTILFPFSIGNFSGIKEFYTSSEVAVNAANTLTETQTRYIEGPVRQIEVSQNFNIALFRTTASNSIWVYKYLWDSDEILQSAWSRWEFKDEIRYMFFVNNLLYLLSKNSEDEFYLHYLDLNRPVGQYGFVESMDKRRDFVTDAGGDINGTPISRAQVQEETRFIKSTGTDEPGTEATPLQLVVNQNGWLYYFSLDEVPVGSTLIAGQSLEWTLEPTQAFGRDYQQRVDTSKNVTVQEYVVHIEESGTFEALGTSPYSADWTYNPFEYLSVEVLQSSALTYTGTFYVPWGERADWSSFVLRGDDTREVTILELEWIGQIISTKGRRQ